MKVRHCYSLEEFDLDCIVYTKFFGMYGYLVMTPLKEIVFITNVYNQEFHYMTNDFIIL